MHVLYLLKYSCAWTLSIKHGKKLKRLRKVFLKYGKHLKVFHDDKVIAKFGEQSCVKVGRFKRISRLKLSPIIYLRVPDKRSLHSPKFLGSSCFACGATEKVEIHHVRKNKDLKDRRHLTQHKSKMI